MSRQEINVKKATDKLYELREAIPTQELYDCLKAVINALADECHANRTAPEPLAHFVSGRELCTKDNPCPVCKPSKAQECKHDWRYIDRAGKRQQCSLCYKIKETKAQECEHGNTADCWACAYNKQVKNAHPEPCNHDIEQIKQTAFKKGYEVAEATISKSVNPRPELPSENDLIRVIGKEYRLLTYNIFSNPNYTQDPIVITQRLATAILQLLEKKENT